MNEWSKQGRIPINKYRRNVGNKIIIKPHKWLLPGRTINRYKNWPVMRHKILCNFKVSPHKRRVLITKELLHYKRKITFISNYKGKNSNLKMEKSGRHHFNQ